MTQFFMARAYRPYSRTMRCISKFDFLAPFAFRLYLAPIFIAAGSQKLNHFESTVQWFGNSDWGLGLPAPALMAGLAVAAELVGGLALLAGVAVRLVAIPLVITMLVAAVTVHGQHGWFAIAPSNPESSMASVLAPLGFPGAEQSLDNSAEVGKRLERAKSLLREHGDYNWLTEKGSFVVLNNGIEFAATYLLMLLSLFFTGAGKWLSIDYWITRYFHPLFHSSDDRPQPLT